jgi:hypothetical protein
MVNIPRFHRGARGSIPRPGETSFFEIIFTTSGSLGVGDLKESGIGSIF